MFFNQFQKFLFASEYEIDALLAEGADYLCPTVPEGQACSLPLFPNTYGGKISLTLPEIPQIIAYILASGTYR